ncbi:hypothetical protein, partial [Hominenteromicrobium sp.]|uniref:hypothetical protein n=1 Tax=Hominenteromicrobium sp. TaxID=3073581 RepID=UPI003AB07E9D
RQCGQTYARTDCEADSCTHRSSHSQAYGSSYRSANGGSHCDAEAQRKGLDRGRTCPRRSRALGR